MLGIGIIGGGRVCGGHARVAQSLATTRLVGIAEVDAERRAAITERFECAGFADYRDLLARDDVDAVVVALPHWLHAEVTIAALQAGKHVLLEKPMAMNVAECDAILAAARASGKTLMVGHSQHFFPVNLEARRRLRDGAIGRICLATDTWYKPFYDGVRPPWFLDASRGGGMWPMNGPHLIDRLMFFLDDRVVSVRAYVGNPILGLPATDVGVAFLEFSRGVCATITHAGYHEGVVRFEAEITGTAAQMKIDGKRFWIGRGNQWEEQPVPLPAPPTRPGREMPGVPFALQMAEFVEAIREGRPPAIPGEWGREVVRVLDACEESSRRGEAIRLD